MAIYDRLSEFGSKTLNKDTRLKCETKHTAWAYFTDEGTALKDYIIVKFKASDSSGAGTGQHQDSASLHKLRIKVYKDGKMVYEDDITGDKGLVTSPTYWINGEGSWSVKVKSVSSGECAKPTGTVFLGSFLAKPAIQDEPTEDENFDDSTGSSGGDNSRLIGIVAVICLIAGVRKIRKG